MDFMEFINTPVGAISMLMLGVLIICIWAVIHFSYLYKKEKSAVVKWFNATHAVLTFINDKNIKKDNKNLFFCKNEVNKNNYW